MKRELNGALEQARTSYQVRRLTDREAASIEEKYRALAPMVQAVSKPDHAEWKSMVARYPGCLREAEMCRVSTITQRAESAFRMCERVGELRHELFAEPQCRVLIVWNDVHALLRDVQAWRSLEDSSGQGIEEFWRWTQSGKSVQTTTLWPGTVELLRANTAGRPDQYTAYQWVACLLNLTQDTLLEELLDRVGVRRG